MILCKKYFLFTLALFLQINISFAQQQKIDSLKRLIFEPRSESEQVDLLNAIAKMYSYINTDSAYDFANQAYLLARKTNSQEGLAKSYDRLGMALHVQGKYKEALVWLDSALALNKKLGDLENELFVMNDLAMVHTRMGQGEIALKMHYEGLKKAADQDLYDLAGSFNGNIGINLLNSGQYDSARISFQNALDYFILNNDKPKQALMLNNIGTVYHYQANYAKAFIFYKQSLDLALAIDNTRSSNISRSNIALIFKRVDSPERAIEYSLPVLKSYQSSGLRVEESNLLQNIATLYEEIDEFTEAIKYGEDAMKIHEDIESSRLSETYAVIGRSYYKIGEKQKGLDYLEKALIKAEKHNDIRAKIFINIFLADHLIVNNENRQAISKLTETLQFLKSINLPEDWYETYLLLSKAKSNLKRHAEAYAYLSLSNKYLDTLKSDAQVNALVRNAIEFETEKREQEVVRLTQEGEIKDLKVKEQSYNFLLLSIGTALIILLAVIFYLYSKQKRVKLTLANQLIQQKLLRVQLNPHFIFNALNAIQEYVIKSNTKSASKFLANFSRLMRQILENSRSEFIPLSQEIEMLEDYLALQKLRKNFTYTIEHDEELDIDSVAIPPMFAQPFVENAVEHGISEGLNNVVIDIQFALENDCVTLTIKDNGVGIKTSIETENQSHESLATLITEERIMILKDNLKKKMAFEVEALSQGTQVVFHLPFKLL